MIKKIMNIGILSIMFVGALSAYNPKEKIYLDHSELDFTGGCVRLHQGNNIWIETNTIHKDKMGIFTLESNLIHDNLHQKDYERTWKCPYCHHHWKIGERCKNDECPSKYTNS